MANITKRFSPKEILKSSDLNEIVEATNENTDKVTQIGHEVGEFKPYVVQHYQSFDTPAADGAIGRLTDADECAQIVEKGYRQIQINGVLLDLYGRDATRMSVYTQLIAANAAQNLFSYTVQISKTTGVSYGASADLGDISSLKTEADNLAEAVNEVHDKVTQIGREVGELATAVDEGVTASATSAAQASASASSAQASAQTATSKLTTIQSQIAEMTTPEGEVIPEIVVANVADNKAKLSELGAKVENLKEDVDNIELTTEKVMEGSKSQKQINAEKLDKVEINAYKEAIKSAIENQDREIAEQGKDITNFKELITDQINNYKPIIINGDATNAADEEDLTSENGLLKIKNRSALNGMGYIILRKDKTFEEQVKLGNTIYEIRYDIDLNGGTLNIPNESVLDFRGGKITNGKLVFNNTKIIGSPYFDGTLTYDGNILNEEVPISWFITKSSGWGHYDFQIKDWTTDHHDDIINALALAKRKDKCWLNMGNIPLVVKQTINISQNIGIKNASLFFMPSEDYQALIECNGSVSWMPIVDSYFRCHEDDNGQWHIGNICLFLNGHNITGHCWWKNISCNHFTGYFLVNTAYLQEVTFENISVGSGSGMVSFNPDGVYGEHKGSCNIVEFNNCNHNQAGNPGHKDDYFSKCQITYIWDFTRVMELSMRKIVNQGDVKYPEKYVMRINSLYSQTCRVELDGFWCEYVSGAVKSKAVIDGACELHLTGGMNIQGIVVNTNAPCVVYDNSSNESYFERTSNFIDGSEINNDSAQVLFYLNKAIYCANDITLSAKFIDWMLKGRIKEFDAHPTTKNQNASFASKLIPLFSLDLKASAIARAKELKNGNYPKDFAISQYKGVTTIIGSCDKDRQSDFCTFSWIDDKAYGINPSNGSVLTVVYRMAPLEDITSENIDSCCASFNNSETMKFTEGHKKEEWTEWRILCMLQKHRALNNNPSGNFKAKGAKVEIAYAKVCANLDIEDFGGIYFKDGDISRVGTPEVFRLDVPASYDNADYLGTIISGTDALFVSARDVYREVDGVLTSVIKKSVAKQDVFTYIDISSTEASLTIENSTKPTIYKCSRKLTSLSFEAIESIGNEVIVEFETESTIDASSFLSLPTGTKVMGELNIEPFTKYVLSVLDGVVVCSKIKVI